MTCTSCKPWFNRRVKFMPTRPMWQCPKSAWTTRLSSPAPLNRECLAPPGILLVICSYLFASLACSSLFIFPHLRYPDTEPDTSLCADCVHCSLGGLVLATKDGHIVLDNTLDARMQIVFKQQLPEVLFLVPTLVPELGSHPPLPPFCLIQ